MAASEGLPKLSLPGFKPELIIGPYGDQSPYKPADQAPEFIRACFESLRNLTKPQQGWRPEAYGLSPDRMLLGNALSLDFILTSQNPPTRRAKLSLSEIGQMRLRDWLQKPRRTLDTEGILCPEACLTLGSYESWRVILGEIDIHPDSIGPYQRIYISKTEEERYTYNRIVVRPFLINAVDPKRSSVTHGIQDPTRVIFSLPLLDRASVVNDEIQYSITRRKFALQDVRKRRDSKIKLLEKLPQQIAKLEEEIQRLETAPTDPAVLKNKQLLEKLEKMPLFSLE